VSGDDANHVRRPNLVSLEIDVEFHLDAGGQRCGRARFRHVLRERGARQPARRQQGIGGGRGQRAGDQVDRRAGRLERRQPIARDEQRDRAPPPRRDELVQTRRGRARPVRWGAIEDQDDPPGHLQSRIVVVSRR
jgi:hypothetical protein